MGFVDRIRKLLGLERKERDRVGVKEASPPGVNGATVLRLGRYDTLQKAHEEECAAQHVMNEHLRAVYEEASCLANELAVETANGGHALKRLRKQTAESS